ncbi:C-type lectin domain family 10 member A-like [Mytilus galloprovincialis]|uniref:C-type lectin domain family 10 member A-like n=1 Tax=Mytilus galloprovincialis TaxID=29158 RepID=UPI003F7C148C
MASMLQVLTLLSASILLSTACDLGWTSYKGKCIYFSNKQLYWNEAEAACEKKGAYLVTIDSEDKMNFVSKYLNVFQSFRYTHFWIGLKDAPIEGHWRWIESGSSLGSYSSWGPGQPDGDTSQNCVQASLNGTQAFWYDAKCENPHHSTHGGYYYICEKPDTSS